MIRKATQLDISSQVDGDMTTSQARFFLIAFAVLATAIIYNATLRQSGSHPAPMSGEGRSLDNPVSHKQRAVPRDAKTLPRHAETAAPLPKDKKVLAIQRRLSDAGYEPGPVDGVVGEQTRAAIIAFEYDNKLPVTGAATEKLLKMIIMGVSPGDVRPDASVAMPDETAAFIKSVQKTLAGLGYDPGPVDGLFGSSTESAIRKFEADHKLPVKGRISGRLVKALKEASGGRLSVIASN